MRILNIYSGNLYGGIETLLETLARYQGSSDDFAIDFCLCFDGRLAKTLRNYTLFELNEVRLRKPWTVWKARRKVKNMLSTGRYDAVLLHSAWAHIIFSPAAKDVGVPVVFSLHDAATGSQWLERLACRNQPDLLLCNSLFTASTAKYLFPALKPISNYWPVELCYKRLSQTEKSSVRRNLLTEASDVVIIQVSRMERWKGHELHLKALSMLRKIPGWKCWMVGGVQRESERRYCKGLQVQIERLGLEGRVQLLGQRSDVSTLLSAADIHCQPNIGPEPFGRTFVEGLAAGLPVVTTRMGAAPEIVNSSCGILVPPDDPGELARSLKLLIQNQALRAELGSNGVSRASALCNPEKQMTKFVEILRAGLQ